MSEAENKPIITDVQPQVEGKKLPDKEPEKFATKNIALFIIIIVVAIVLGISSRNSNTEEDLMSQLPDFVDSEAVDNQVPGGVVMGERDEQSTDETSTNKKETWYVFWHEDTKLWMAYPSDIPPGFGQLYNFVIEVEPILDIPSELPYSYGQEVAILDQQILATGQYGEEIGLAVPQSRRVINFTDWHTKQFMWLDNGDECSVGFGRTLIFYPDNYRVMISLSVSKDKQQQIIDEMPEFFTSNPACGDKPVWDQDKQVDFYQALVAQQGTGLAQDWYIIFDRIISTIKLY